MQVPEFRSDHDPSVAGTATSPAPSSPNLQKRFRAWRGLLVLVLVFFGTAAGGIYYARNIYRTGRWDDLPIVLGLLLPVGLVLWTLARNRIKTGRWTEPREQRIERAARAARQTPAQVRARSLSRSMLTWAGYTAFDRSRPLSQRIAAWIVLAGYGLYLLLLAGVGVVAIGASFADNNTFGQRVLFAGVGLLLLVMPGKAVLMLVRRRQAGSLRITSEELSEQQTRRKDWRLSESKKPLQSKVITIVFAVAVEIYLWLRVTVYHSRHRHESWVTPLFALPACIWTIWVQWRPPRQVEPRHTNAEPAQTAPDATE